MEEQSEEKKEFQPLSREAADALVVENMGWAESIARSVARSWNLDWKIDGLDGAAMEALIFCSRRFQPERGIPFKGYARRRIHEAATEAARKSRGWRKTSLTMSGTEQKAREISVQLFEIFPELRDGDLPSSEDSQSDDTGAYRSAIREMLIGASILATKDVASDSASAEELIDYKRMVEALAELEPVHQLLMWKVYWEGMSLRGVAEEWKTDGLNVIREHQSLILYLNKNFASGKHSSLKPKIRPGLRPYGMQLKKDGQDGPFTKLIMGKAV